MREPSTGVTAALRRMWAGQTLKLVIAIVHEEDAGPVVSQLVDSRLPVTQIASTGGLLRSGNATLLIGVGSEGVEPVMEILRTKCGKREVPVSPTLEDKTVEGGAVVFVLDLEELAKF